MADYESTNIVIVHSGGVDPNRLAMDADLPLPHTVRSFTTQNELEARDVDRLAVGVDVLLVDRRSLGSALVRHLREIKATRTLQFSVKVFEGHETVDLPEPVPVSPSRSTHPKSWSLAEDKSRPGIRRVLDGGIQVYHYEESPSRIGQERKEA